MPIGAIQFRDVTKTYHILQRATPRLGAWFLSKAFEHFRREPFDALRGISFDIAPGEMIGILGSNGSGKSTILKLVAGITDPSAGEISVEGRVASLLELGVGFHPDLTGVENIFYNGVMMGLTREQILAKYEQIVVFSGLADFLYEPVKHYSSGMYSRLACSVALHLDPDIILVDEILAVGDAEFQQRGILKILELHKRGVTVLLVTHETATAREICDRAIWIEGGLLRDEGKPQRVCGDYVRYMMSRVPPGGIFGREPSGNADTRISGVRLVVDDRQSSSIQTGRSARIDVDVESGEKEICLGLLLRWTDGRILMQDFSGPITLGQDKATLHYDIERWPLLESSVSVSIVVLSGDGKSVRAKVFDALTIETTTPNWQLGETLVNPRVEWSG